MDNNFIELKTLLEKSIDIQNKNHELLLTILNKINKQSDFKQFSLNLAADVLVELLKGNNK